MTLGRLIHFFIPERRLGGISAKRYGLIFVWLDILAFIVQLAGASITTQREVPTSTIMLGIHIYMGGIGLQELFVLIFGALTIHLHRRMVQMENYGGLDNEKTTRGSVSWRWLFAALYAALILITVCAIALGERGILTKVADPNHLPTMPVCAGHGSDEPCFDSRGIRICARRDANVPCSAHSERHSSWSGLAGPGLGIPQSQQKGEKAHQAREERSEESRERAQEEWEE